MGYDIALDGDLLVAGALNNPVSGQNAAGQAYVLRRTGTTWALEQTCRKRVATWPAFGSAVAVDEANNTIIIGGYGANANNLQYNQHYMPIHMRMAHGHCKMSLPEAVSPQAQV